MKVGQSTGVSFTDIGLVSQTQYTYFVKAYDAAGNLSASSNSATVTTPQLTTTDQTRPTSPTNLKLTSLTASLAQIEWNAATDNVGIAGYLVFKDGMQIATTNALIYVDSNLSTSGQIIFTVVAVDAAGNLSAASTPLTVNLLGRPPVKPKNVVVK
jgi:chitinase